mmetsp:Transcript_71612/g.190471  ORF Transcript_71612/g.190471 Transcript_71612/m.190471 type:complete len:281 (-) Transcript_71612:184-1026(-)
MASSACTLALRRLQGFLKHVFVLHADVLNNFFMRRLHLPADRATELQVVALSDRLDLFLNEVRDQLLQRFIIFSLGVVLRLHLTLHLLLLCLVALLAQAIVALPAVKEALALEDILAASVALVVVVRFSSLEAMSLGALWLGHRLPSHAHAAKELLDDLAHEELLLHHPPHGWATTCSTFALPTLPRLPAEGEVAAHEQLIEHSLLIKIKVPAASATEECSEDVLEVLSARLVEFLLVHAPRSVVQRSLVRVRQDLVCSGYLLELRRGFWVVRILVGVPA